MRPSGSWRGGRASLATRVLGALMLTLTLTPVGAAQRLDDSASPLRQVAPQQSLSEQGRSLQDSDDPRTAVVRYGGVTYKLATTPYVGRQARIYLVIPARIAGLRSPAGLRAEWLGQGVFADGSARPGERRLVWSGTVRGPWLVETLDLTLNLDLRELTLPGGGAVGFESYFEIETLP